MNTTPRTAGLASWARRLAWSAEHIEEAFRAEYLQCITKGIRRQHEHAPLPAQLLILTAAAESTGDLAPLTTYLRDWADDLEEGVMTTTTTDLGTFLDTDVQPALVEHLDVVFPEFTWQRRRSHCAATAQPPNFPVQAGHKRTDRLTVYPDRKH